MGDIHDVASSAFLETTFRSSFSFHCQRVEEIAQDSRKHHALVMSYFSSTAEPDLETENAVRKSLIAYILKPEYHIYIQLFSVAPVESTSTDHS